MQAAALDRARARVREGAGPAGDTRSADPRVARAQHVSGSGGDAAILIRRPGNQHTLYPTAGAQRKYAAGCLRDTPSGPKGGQRWAKDSLEGKKLEQGSNGVAGGN